MGQILEFTPLLIEGTCMTIKLTVVSAVISTGRRRMQAP